jgi:tetratricopeptide (TPR) repeat protein
LLIVNHKVSEIALPMLETGINLDTIFIARDEQEQAFRQLLLHWQNLLQTTTSTPPPTTHIYQPPSPQHKIQGPVTLLAGDSGLGKSMLLKRYHIIASEPAYHLKITAIIDWRLAGDIDSRQFAASTTQEGDALAFFNMLHSKLAAVLSVRTGNLQKQLNSFRAYQSAVVAVKDVRDQAYFTVLSLRTNENYAPLAWLTKADMPALMRWCFEQHWPACQEEQIAGIVEKYLGKDTGIGKKHLSKLREALQNNLSEQQLETYLYPERALATGLGRDLNSQARRLPLLLFFDAYERIAGTDTWLRHVMSAAGRRVGWVIAGQGLVWSNEEQRSDDDNSQVKYSYQDIIPADRLLSVDFAASAAGTFSVANILDYFTQLYMQRPSLPMINQADAERIFDITQGNPLVVNSIASSYAYKPDLDNILEKARRNMAELYFSNARNDEQERKKLYGLAMLRRVNNASIVTALSGLDAQSHTHTYEQLLQQLHNRYHFISVEHGQPLLHEKARNNLRRWLLFEGRKTPDFTFVAERLVEIQQFQLHELERQYHYSSLRAYMEDDEWINVYLDFVEACFWFNAETGIFHALALMLAVMLYRPHIMYEVEQLSAFFISIIPPLYRDLWQWLIQSLLATDQRTATPSVLLAGLQELHQQLTYLMAFPPLAFSSTRGLNYEYGLDRLKQRVSGTERYREFLTYEARLRENLGRERLYGTTEQVRASRAEIIDQLNGLVEELINVSFNDLCLLQGGFPGEYARELEGALWWLQGMTYREYADDRSAALSYYQKALKHLSDHNELRTDFARTYWALAESHFARQQYQDCIDCLNEALKIKDDYVDAYYSLGNALYELGRYAEAVVQYQYVLALHDHYLPAFINLGNTYSELKRYQEALAEYAMACKLDPQNYFPYYNRGCTYMELKKYPAALQDFMQTIALNADCAAAYIGRGNLYGLSGDYQKARADYQRAVEIDQNDINNAWMAMWASFGKTTIGGEAQEQLAKLICLAPQHYIAHICHAMSMALQRRKLNDIEPVLELALHQEPEQWDTYFWKGIIFAFCGQVAEAREAIDQSLHLGLPPLLLMPLYWLESVVPRFFNTYAHPLLERYNL